MRALRIRGWILIAGCLAVTAVVYCTIHLRSRAPASPQAVNSAEDEVYEAVVRDMVTPNHGQAHISQLVFDDTVLIGFMGGTDSKACKVSVRKQLRLEDKTPPFNTLADKIYRVLTSGYDDDSLRAETVQDFVNKSCTGGPLSKTFHTDFPRFFVDSNSVFLDFVPANKNGSKDFRQTFPGASGIISLSHVGFDSALQEGMVSTSFVCGGLCGTGRLYLLKKVKGRWEVAENSIVWVS